MYSSAGSAGGFLIVLLLPTDLQSEGGDGSQLGGAPVRGPWRDAQLMLAAISTTGDSAQLLTLNAVLGLLKEFKKPASVVRGATHRVTSIGIDATGDSNIDGIAQQSGTSSIQLLGTSVGFATVGQPSCLQ